MKTTLVTAFLVLACIVGLLTIGCEQVTSPLPQNSGSLVQGKQSIDKEPPGVHFLPRPIFNKLAETKPGEFATQSGWSGIQPGWESKLCSSDRDTWVGGDTTTYGNTVKIWHDVLDHFDTMTVTVDVVDSTTFGAVDFFPSIQKFHHNPEIHLNYSNYGLTDRDAAALNIYWWDPVNNFWQLISDHPKIDTKKNCVIFTVQHFSRYAFGR